MLLQKTDDWFSAFHPFEDIQRWYKTLAEENGDLVRYVDSIGKTQEGRPIFAVHIGKGDAVKSDLDEIEPRRPNKIWLQWYTT